jgi:hypothetical protein
MDKGEEGERDRKGREREKGERGQRDRRRKGKRTFAAASFYKGTKSHYEGLTLMASPVCSYLPQVRLQCHCTGG